MSSMWQSLLNVANGGSGNTFFIRSQVWSVGKCYRRIWPTFGSGMEKVITSGTLLVLYKWIRRVPEDYLTILEAKTEDVQTIWTEHTKQSQLAPNVTFNNITSLRLNMICFTNKCRRRRPAGQKLRQI
ncbi:hypothetical protein DPMN_179988 [Dreissena polymorpha]|uniref:Uncharacterized protein n=1 Tax=Dreissena polymorpha TaxID=45954 RepID=A0A9D4EDC7_DREPO|nr:hypothetical protein DPMN_179988 [Dreissena polymorpha]